MGMATFTDDEQQISDEFKKIASFSENIKTKYPQLKTLSIGMSGDYKWLLTSEALWLE